jgi:hypothetical protein
MSEASSEMKIHNPRSQSVLYTVWCLQTHQDDKKQEVKEILGHLRRFKSTFFTEMEQLGDR